MGGGRFLLLLFDLNLVDIKILCLVLEVELATFQFRLWTDLVGVNLQAPLPSQVLLPLSLIIN